ncbi:MAG: glycosyltransferase [Halobacteriovoraceae bacterium]|nr:glycosyltransferase [Halobacteriovoraceae bacterium]
MLNVNYTLDPETGGGTAQRTYQLTKFLVEENCDVTLVSNDIGESKNVAQSIPGATPLIVPALIKRFPIPYRNIFRLNQKVKECDVIHLMSHWTILNVLVYIFSRRHKKKLFLCPAGSLNGLGRSKGIKKIFNTVIGKKILKNAEGRIIISPTEGEDLIIAAGGKVSYQWIPNGIVFKDYQLVQEGNFFDKFNIPEKPFLLFLGRLNSIKGPDLLLEAFFLSQDILEEKNLVFAGPNQEGMQELLENRAKEFGISERIFFTGYIDGKDKISALQKCEYLVIPSRKEAMSIVVLEAGAAGKSVVFTDQCGLDFLAEEGLAVLTSTDPKSIAEGIQKLECQNYQSMGLNLSEYVKENFSWNKIVKEHLRFFQQEENCPKV